jgi:heme/copper-type cytochrome/quinol oxidase subunit 4
MSESHKPISDKFYLVVFACLAVLTGMSFLVSESVPSRIATILIILGVSSVKVFLVAAFFMHLNVDWPKVGGMIAVALVLSTVLVFALVPDIMNAPRDKPNPPPAVALAPGGVPLPSPAAHHE